MVRIGQVEVDTHTGDITELELVAIVNAANSDLWMGSGVAGAIKRKGGVEIEQEAMAKGPIRPGQAVITGAGRLKAKYVIHCAGMPPGGRATVEYVRSSVEHALRLAKESGIRHVAFPAIGAGVGGLSMEEAARAILDGIEKHADDPGSLERIVLVGYKQESADVFDKVLSDRGGR